LGAATARSACDHGPLSALVSLSFGAEASARTLLRENRGGLFDESVGSAWPDIVRL